MEHLHYVHERQPLWHWLNNPVLAEGVLLAFPWNWTRGQTLTRRPENLHQQAAAQFRSNQGPSLIPVPTGTPHKEYSLGNCGWATTK
jgi:hypothetical protein